MIAIRRFIFVAAMTLASVKFVRSVVPKTHVGAEDNLLENRVPCLDQSLRYRKRLQDVVNVDLQIGIISLHSLSLSRMELKGEPRRSSFRIVLDSFLTLDRWRWVVFGYPHHFAVCCVWRK